MIKQIGNNIIQPAAHVDRDGELIVGPNSVVSHEAWIETHTHDFNSDNWAKKDFPHKLIIEGQVYVGARAMILGGRKHIAEGVLIGAGAVVAKNIDEPYTKWAGFPARKIGLRKKVNLQL